MDSNSYLNPKELSAKCGAAIKLLNADINDFDSMKTNLNSLIEDEVLKGASADALKNNIKDYYIAIGLSLSANNSDITDLESLMITLSNEDIYNGDTICAAYDRAKKSKEENELNAKLARAAEAAYSPIWYFKKGVGWVQDDAPNPFTGLVQKYDAIVKAESELMQLFQNKKDSFDNIESSTSSLLSCGNEIRETANEILLTMEEQKKDNTYVPGVSSSYLQRLLVSQNERSKELASELVESDEYGDSLIDTKYKDDPDVKELKETNERYEKMVNNSSNTIASEEAKKGLIEAKKDKIKKILEKTNHSAEYVEAYEKMCDRGYSADKLEDLMWYWLKVDDMNNLEGIEIPYSWEKELERDVLYCEWIKENSTDDIAEDYYNDYIAGKKETIKIISGRTVSDANEQYNEIIKNRYREKPTLIDFIKAGWIVDKTIINEKRILSDKTNSNKKNDFEDAFFRNVQNNPGRIVNEVYNNLSWNISNKTIKKQYNQNILGWEEYKQSQSSRSLPYKMFIENQHDFGDKLYYGIYVPGLSDRAMKDNFEKGKGLYGANNLCEVIAVYNVLTSMGEDVDFPKLVRRFASIGPSLGGNFGTAPDDVQDYLIMSGYDAETIDTTKLRKDECGGLLKEYDAFIITDWNKPRADGAIHTMAITVDKKVDPNTGEVEFTIIRHNDFNPSGTGYTKYESAEKIYDLIMEYTLEYNTNEPMDDGTIKVIGIKK